MKILSKKWLDISVFIIISLLFSGCSVIKYNMSEEKNFYPKITVSTEEQKAKFAKAMLWDEQAGGANNSNGKFLIQELINDGMVEAAEYSIRNNIQFARMNNEINIAVREKALRLLINNLKFDYLDEYWSGVYENNPRGAYYNIRYILDAMAWVGENQPHSSYAKYSNKVISSYYINGCSELAIANRKNPVNIVDLLIKKQCIPEEDKIVYWFSKYVKNFPNERSDQVAMATKNGDHYFEKGNYQIAAAWYFAALNLSKDDNVDIDFDDYQTSVFKIFRIGVPLHDAINLAMASGRKNYNATVEKCEKRLRLIQGAGIQSAKLQLVEVKE